MRKLAFATAFGAAAMVSGPVLAADEFVFDKSHTHILFYIDHLGFSTTQGEFLDFEGSLALDTDAPENSNVSVTIDAASLDSGWADRDTHLRSADFLDVETHPTITFASTGVTVTGDNTAEVAGDLTILGNTQPVVLDVTLINMGEHPFNGQTVAGFEATTTISRSAFGMDFGVPAIGDEVEIVINTETTPAS